jgi:outer membrane protein insertion porin family
MNPLLLAFALTLGPAQAPAAPQSTEAATPSFSVDGPVLVEFVDVRGYRLMPRDTVLYNIRTVPGMVLDREVVARDIQALFATGNFDDIRVEAEPGETEGSVVLVFEVTEKPRVGDIAYIGLKSVTEADLLDRFAELGVVVQRELPYDPSMVRRAQVAIREILAIAGRQNATVEVETYQQTLSRIGIEFIIDEGPKIKVQEIEIVGNTVFTDAQIKARMEYIKETGPIVSFRNLDLYHEEKLLADAFNGIQALYQEHGYLRANILEPEVEVRPHLISRTLPLIKPSFPWGIPLPFWKKEVDRYFIRLTIEENDQYRVGDVQITGNTQVSDEIIQRAVGLESGEVFNMTAMRDGFNSLVELYGQAGFINFSPSPIYVLDDEARTVNVTIDIDEDRQFFVSRINFRGNTTTRDNVIRREFLLNEGDAFNSQALELSILRVNQLDYFEPIEEADYEVRPSVTEPEVEITVNLEERGRNTIGFTGGVSGIGGSFLGINYETNNFLGFGETLSVAAQGGTRQSNYVFSFTEPYLFDRPISTGFSVFSTEYRFDQARDVFGLDPDDLPEGFGLENRLNFNQSRKGFTVFSSYPMALFQRIGVTFQFADSSTDAVNQATAQYFEGVQQYQGQGFAQSGGSFSDFRTRSITPNYVWNTVNNPSFPTRGQSFSMSAQFTGGFLGGNVNYYRPVIEYRGFKPMNGGRNTLAFRLQTSHISGFSRTSAPFYERFRLGGDFDVRGFDFQALIPMAWVESSVTDPATGITFVRDSLAWIGGDTMAVANLEYRIPLVGYMFTLAPFLDVGNTWAIRKEQLRRQIVLPDGTARSEEVRFVPGTNSGLRASTGIELQVMMPVINAPFRVMYYYNPLRLDRTVTGPLSGTQFQIRQEDRGFKFTVGRTF